MELCTPHEEYTHNALKVRGLWHLQSHTDEEKAAILRALNGESREGDPEHFDAVLAAQFMLFALSIEIGGISLLDSDDAGGSLCPLCALEALEAADPLKLIDDMADELRAEAAIKGALKPETMQ